MNDLDRMIRDALAEEDAELLEQVGGEQSLLQKGLELFKSNSKWLVMMVVTVQLVFLSLVVYSAVRFFQAEEIKDFVMWAVVFMFANLTVAMLKIWSWMEINRNSVTREIKRLELQVAYMTKRLGQE